jgi:hypothetical protein
MRGYYTSRQAAAAIGISLTQFRKLCLDEAQGFPNHRLHNRTYYYPMVATQNWLKVHRVLPKVSNTRGVDNTLTFDNSLAVLFHRLLPPMQLNKTCNSLKML